MRRRALAIVALAGIAAGTVSAQTFRSRVALVRLPVVVTSATGEPVEGLQSADFEVLDNGIRQEITTFAAGETGVSGTLVAPAAERK